MKFDRSAQDSMRKSRMTQGFRNTLDARKTYLSNRSKFQSETDHLQNMVNHKKSHSMYSGADLERKESMIDKATDNSFFSLRQNLSKSVARENKNVTSTSFAVPDEKVQAKRFLFNQIAKSQNRNNQKNLTFGNILGNESLLDSSKLNILNRHETRQNRGLSNSINFISHSPVTRHRITTEGGIFPMNDSTRQ